MQNVESNRKEIEMLYEGLVEIVNHSQMDADYTIGVLAKVLVLLAIASGRDKQQFMDQMGYVWDFETFFQPESHEKH